MSYLSSPLKGGYFYKSKHLSLPSPAVAQYLRTCCSNCSCLFTWELQPCWQHTSFFACDIAPNTFRMTGFRRRIALGTKFPAHVWAQLCLTWEGWTPPTPKPLTFFLLIKFLGTDWFSALGHGIFKLPILVCIWKTPRTYLLWIISSHVFTEWTKLLGLQPNLRSSWWGSRIFGTDGLLDPTVITPIGVSSMGRVVKN